ncbi:LuxR C-terminal-related transcriptional regulator [Kitasatospora sp. NPDC058170]|uniref:LuxR C-terminal-related transcriptional regulator n=1 Tax=Kitasatospora sp. NPDC058170 TaxID=3346364 RepID=UPI0036DB404E
MPVSLPERPDLSDAEVLLLRQVAGGHLNAAVSRATGIPEKSVAAAVNALMSKLGTANRHHAAALGAAWGWVRAEDVPVINPSGQQLPKGRRKVLEALVAGDEPETAAGRLGLSENTVRVYIQDVLRALGVRSRQQAAAIALLTGIVPPSALGDGWPDTGLAAVHGPADRQPAGVS